LLAAVSLLLAPGGAGAQDAGAYSQQELEQMIAPIALYPDPLLAQILMAATYPLDVVEAAHWSRIRPGLAGEEALRAAEGEDWDPSVKSLLAFPQVLARMDENRQWTQSLGDAFLDQQAQLMDTVQALRRRAEAAGNLRSNDRLQVIDDGSALMVEPLDPGIVYVPYYDPLVAYGPWWWPAYPPVSLRPWPGYYARPGYPGAVYWGPPVGISTGHFFGAFDWNERRVRQAQVHDDHYRHGAGVNRVGTRSDQRRYPSPAARPEPRAEARPEGWRPGPAVQTRAHPQPAAPARTAPVIQPAPAAPRLDHHRERPAAAQPAHPPPGIRPAPLILPAPPAPALRAPVEKNAPPGPGARHETPRTGARMLDRR